MSDTPKTQSQRLRAALYILWEQQRADKMEFEEFYTKQMEHIIEAVKARLV